VTMNVELQFHRWSAGKPHINGRDIELQEVVFMWSMSTILTAGQGNCRQPCSWLVQLSE
jgi:hypothetical protein